MEGDRSAGVECVQGHVHMVMEMAPKYSISEAMGMKKKPYWGNHFWRRGYCVSTVGMDEKTIRKYVKYQEFQEKREESAQQEFLF